MHPGIAELRRYGQKQAEEVVDNAWEEEMYREVIKAGQPLPRTCSDRFPGGTVVDKLSIPARNEMLRGGQTLHGEFCAQYGLQDLGQMAQVLKYLDRNGQWTLGYVPLDGNCLFEAVCKGLDLPEEYGSIHLRREIAVFAAQNGTKFYQLYFQHLREEYGKEHDEEENQAVHAGPYSVHSYLRKLMEDGTWGDAICIDMISRMWGLKITVLVAKGAKIWELRVRHNEIMQYTDLVLVFNGVNHYCAATKQGKKSKHCQAKVDDMESVEVEKGTQTERKETTDKCMQTGQPEKQKLAVKMPRKNFSCKDCGKSYDHKRSLVRHKLAHHTAVPVEEKTCQHCHKILGSVIWKEGHEKECPRQPGYQKKSCSVQGCFAEFARVSNLKVHMRKVHPNM